MGGGENSVEVLTELETETDKPKYGLAGVEPVLGGMVYVARRPGPVRMTGDAEVPREEPPIEATGIDVPRGKEAGAAGIVVDGRSSGGPYDSVVERVGLPGDDSPSDGLIDDVVAE